MESSIQMRSVPHVVEFKGKKHTLLFDMAAFAMAEQTYYLEYGRTCNCGEIIVEMLDGMTSALLALTYGALRSGGGKMTYNAFVNEVFTYDQYDLLMDVVEKAIVQAMGVEDAPAVTGDEKN